MDDRAIGGDRTAILYSLTYIDPHVLSSVALIEVAWFRDRSFRFTEHEPCMVSSKALIVYVGPWTKRILGLRTLTKRLSSGDRRGDVQGMLGFPGSVKRI